MMSAAPSPVPVLILGAGGHAKVVIELLRARSDAFSIAGLLDTDGSRRSVLGVRVLGSDDQLGPLRRAGLKHAFVARGDNRTRHAGLERLSKHGFELVNAVSPAAIVSASAVLGRGIAVMAGAVINADSRIADLAIINTRASVDHDGSIGEAAHVCPGCSLAGRVTIGRMAFIGTGSSAIPGVTVGENSVIGAGSCIVRNIPANSVAFGVPAKIVRVHDDAGKSRE
jgi:UDP-perosamine 4-acetyltransferase